MNATPWWVTVLIGALTVSAAFVAARLGSHRADEATRQRAEAAEREEWFRRLQWAAGLTLANDQNSRTAGFAILQVLATSPLATASDLALLAALNDNEVLDRLEQASYQGIDGVEFGVDDGDERTGSGRTVNPDG